MSPNVTLHLPVTVTRPLLPVLALNLPLDAVDGLLLDAELQSPRGDYIPRGILSPWSLGCPVS